MSRPSGVAGNERGVVLLHALVVISVLSAIGAGLLRDDLEYRTRHALMVQSDQARAQMRSIEALAGALMAAEASAGALDHLGEAWASPQTLEMDGVMAEVRLVDLQGRLNVNGLLRRVEGDDTDQNTSPRLEPDPALLALLGALTDAAGGARRLPGRIAEWTAEMVSDLPGAAADEPYLRRNPPELRPAAPVLSTEELRRVDGMTPLVFTALFTARDAPLTALPVATEINVNTAPPALLRAMTHGAPPSSIAALDEARRARPFQSVAAFQNYVARHFSPAASDRVAALPLTVASEWFLIDATLGVGATRLRLHAILYRSADGESRIVLRSDRAP